MAEVPAGTMFIVTTLGVSRSLPPPKSMQSAFHQHHLSVLRQDLLKELKGFAGKAESKSLS